VSSWRAAATLAKLRASLPRRVMMASLRWRIGAAGGLPLDGPCHGPAQEPGALPGDVPAG